MNLMFWKKKTTDADAEAESAPQEPHADMKPQESLDFAESGQDATEPPTEALERMPSGAEEDSAEAPDRPGLIERLRLRLGVLAGYFRKPPVFLAAEEEARSGRDAQDDGEEREERQRGRSAAEQDGESVETGAEIEAVPVRSKKKLVIGGSIAIVVLILASIAIAYWPSHKEPQKRWGTSHDLSPDQARLADPGPDQTRPADPEPDTGRLETLMKENAELQARLKALENEQLQQPTSYAAPGGQEAESAASSAEHGEMTVGISDPRAAAMTLKEAIEAMNAVSGGGRKSDK